jgi:hypothetical protein
MKLVTVNSTLSRSLTSLRLIAFISLFLLPSLAKADFTRFTSSPVLISSTGFKMESIVIRETPMDSSDIDTVWFMIQGDTSIQLVSTSPEAYTAWASIHIRYQGAPGDTSFAWVTIWDHDRIDTVAIIGINPDTNGGGGGALNPNVVFSTPNFYDMMRGDSNCKTVTVYNNENYAISLTSVNLSGGTYAIRNLTLPQTIAANSNYTFTLCYFAADSTYFTWDSIRFAYSEHGKSHNAGNVIYIVVNNCFSMADDSLRFGNMEVGDDSTGSFFIVNNSSSPMDVTISRMYTGGPDTWTVIDSTVTIPAHDTATVSIRVDVSGAGFGYSIYKLIGPDSLCERWLTAWVHGYNASCFTLNVDTLLLGPIRVGEDTTIQVQLINTSNDSIVVNYLQYGNDTCVTYTWSQSFPVTLQPGDTLNMTLNVEADDVCQSFSQGFAFYNVLDSAACGWSLIGIDGSTFSNGIMRQVDLYDEEDEILIETSEASTTVRVRLMNNSSTNVGVVSIGLRYGTNFQLSPVLPIPSMLAPEQGFDVDVQFAASSAGDFYDTLIVSLTDGTTSRIVIHGKQSTSGVSGPSATEVILNAWPNPAVGQFTLDMKNVEHAMISISDVLGRTIHQSMSNFPATFDVSTLGLAPGSYVIRVSGKDAAGATFVRSTMISVK